MTREILKDRESAFEYEFCHRVDQQLLARLQEQLRAEERRKALSRGTGIEDEAVLRELDALDISGECALALTLYPLVHVAWADGKVDDREREAVLEAAESIGHRRDTPSQRLLEAWLVDQPGDRIYEAWKKYVAALMQTISPVARRVLKLSLAARSRHVAEATGGILGIHKVSAAEETALKDLSDVVEQAAEGASAGD